MSCLYLVSHITCEQSNSVVYFSTKYAMQITSFVPRCTQVLHAMGLNQLQQSMRTLFT